MTKSEKKEIKSLIKQYIILRDSEKCRRCGTTENLAASHIYSVGQHKKLEFDIDNIILLCYKCHIHFWHKEPIAAGIWIQTVLDPKVLERLKLRSQQTGKGMHDYKILKVMLNQQIKSLKI
jgi:5-methylcytosine-specific restriction endonuclease McrA